MKLRVIFATLGFLTVIPTWLEARGTDGPIPQSPEARRKRERETLAWNEKTLIGAYERVGRKDSRWDAPAREALQLMARAFSHVGDSPTTAREIRSALEKSVAAGCDDPLIVLSNVRFHLDASPSHDQPLAEALKSMLASDYPAVRKATGLYTSANRKASRIKTNAKAREEAAAEVDMALAMLPKSFAEDGAGSPLENVWLENLRKNVSPVLRQTEGSLKAGYDRADAALARAPAAKTVRLIYKGIFYTQYAWEARGTGYANTVSTENFQKFTDRLREAEKALEEAWKLNPDHAWIPDAMLEVVKGLQLDRPAMELWFERAMILDEKNFRACGTKLDWLSARWYGSHEETLEFGRACRDTRNVASGIPLLLAAAHLDVYRTLPEERRTDYMSKDEVWTNLREVYEEHLTRFPADVSARSRYACFSWLCGRYAEAANQFRKLGDAIKPDKDFSRELMEYARNESDKKANTSGQETVRP